MIGNPAVVAAIVVLTADALLFVALIVLKSFHRRRVRRHDERRNHYVNVLSKHLAFENSVTPIPPEAGEDEAFIDAIIDLRNTLTGVEIRKLSVIANRYELIDRQSRRLRQRMPMTRRLRAAVSLAELGNDHSAGILMDHLDDRVPEIRIQAARGLARIGYTPAIDHIVDRLEVEDPWVRARFGDSLATFGSKASQPLMAYVRVNHHAGDIQAVVQAIATLSVIGDHTVGPQMAEVAASSTRTEIQIAAIGALGSVGGSHTVGSVVAALDSDDWRVRAKAATSLGMIGDAVASDALVAALEDEAWWVRRNSAAALTRIAGGKEHLYRALTSEDMFARDAAAEALEDVGELTRARRNHEEGAASEDELRLIRHMRTVRVLSA